MNQSNASDHKYQVSLAIEHIRSAFSIIDENGEKAEIEDLALLKEPAQLFCTNAGSWRLASIDAVQNEEEVFDVRIDQSMFSEHTGNLNALISYAEKLYRSGEMWKAEVECLGKPKHKGGCWVKTTGSFLGSSSCLCRAQEGKLTCQVHEEFEEASRLFLEALERSSK